MTRYLTIAAAQMGPIARSENRQSVVRRLIELMRQAKSMGAEVVAYPEATLTAFFPHWFTADEEEVDAWFEHAMPGPQTQPLFDEARRLGIGFHLGYCELDLSTGRKRRFNTSILVDANGNILGKYRKIHLPGHADHRQQTPFQNLEKRYFEVGDLGFGAWRAWGGVAGMIICNDRRWPESYRVLGLQGVDMIFCGYNTPVHHPAAPDHDRLGQFHNELSMQSGAYQNSAWVIGIAKAGLEEGVDMIAGSCIIAPPGDIVARASSAGDEVIVARCDLDLG
ncbi:MAG: N-carbamoyl-D-amino-acid hydrolase, partial [Rhodoferax sp.]|nr:N-carbamoyl-D-amino-acid hydrolase [Rhodoferax sp.]